MKKVLVASKSCGNGLGEDGVAKLFYEKGIAADFIKLKDVDSLADYCGIVIGMDPFGEAQFDAAPNLRVIMKFGVGVENIDVNAAAQRGIVVKNMPGVNNDAVAEMAFALLISTARRVTESDRAVRRGEWPRMLGGALQEKTLGIVGTGAIGRTLARYTRGFDMKLIGYDLYQNEEFTAMGGTYVSFEELLKTADFISIHVPLTPETKHMFNRERFAQMKPTAILVNTSRGPVVDERALYESLKNGVITGAGMDVFETEPAFDTPLKELENVVLTSHIAAFTRETMLRMDLRCVALMADTLAAVADI